MSRWFIHPQIKKVDGAEVEVEVKFSHTAVTQKLVTDKPEFHRLSAKCGWIAVWLGYKCHDGSTDIARVNFAMKSRTYNYHSPISATPVTVKKSNGQEVQTNPLEPVFKVVKDSTGGMGKARMLAHLIKTTGNEDLAKRVIQLIDEEIPRAEEIIRLADEKRAAKAAKAA